MNSVDKMRLKDPFAFEKRYCDLLAGLVGDLDQVIRNIDVAYLDYLERTCAQKRISEDDELPF
jgi:hypothetical protein